MGYDSGYTFIRSHAPDDEAAIPRKSTYALESTSRVMNVDYEIVRYGPEFKKQVVDLQANLWSPSLALNTAYFEWKYERNPYLPAPLVYLAMHDGRVVGMRGFFGVQWEAGLARHKVPGLYADDLVIAPGHRNRGLIARIMAVAFKDLASTEYQYVFNLSAGPITRLASLSMGWRSAGSVQPMRWRSWPRTLQAGLRRLLGWLPLAFRPIDRLFFGSFEMRRRPFADLDKLRSRQPISAVPWISLEDTPRCATMAELVERIAGEGRIRHVRDRVYFAWRFQNPLSRYRFLFWDKTGLDGYLVLQEYTSEFASGEGVNVVDWEGTTTAVQADLLQAAVNYAGDRNLMIWSATLAPETIALLRAQGFKSERKPHSIIQQSPVVFVRPIRDQHLGGDWLLSDRHLLDLHDWELRMLYSMSG
jgi:GNAT superfamily N-acetyltransferase